MEKERERDEKKSKNKNINPIKEEFKYEFFEEIENDDEYERTLEKDIETNCELSVYVNKLEIDERSDNDLLTLEKQDIIDFKNYQIQKFKAYIFSLEKEKEDLIENFKNTTNVLLERIKELEFGVSGIRPETPFITKKLKTNKSSSSNNNVSSNIINRNSLNLNLNNKSNNKSNNNKNVNMNSNNLNKMFFGDEEDINNPSFNSSNSFSNKSNAQSNKQRCPHCTKEFPNEIFLQHSLDCLRNKIRCKKCNELIDEKFKKEHLLEWRSKERIEEAINTKNQKLLQTCLDHGATVNKIMNEETGDTILHLIAKSDNTRVLEVLISTDLNINILNKNNETPLIVAINEGHIKLAKFLIDIGADLTKRNGADMSPLMLACQKGLRYLVEYLIDNNAEINEKASISGLTPLMCCKDEELALFLIQKGAKIQNRPNSTFKNK